MLLRAAIQESLPTSSKCEMRPCFSGCPSARFLGLGMSTKATAPSESGSSAGANSRTPSKSCMVAGRATAGGKSALCQDTHSSKSFCSSCLLSLHKADECHDSLSDLPRF